MINNLLRETNKKKVKTTPVAADWPLKLPAIITPIVKTPRITGKMESATRNPYSAIIRSLKRFGR